MYADPIRSSAISCRILHRVSHSTRAPTTLTARRLLPFVQAGAYPSLPLLLFNSSPSISPSPTVAVMSSWAYFRKHWIKPEVYPLIGAMGAALGVCAVALINKARDPTCTWSKSKRKGEVDVFSTMDEVVPLWSSSKTGSTSIFGKDTSIRASKFMHTESPPPVTVRIGEEEAEEEAEEESAAPIDEPVSGSQPATEAAAVIEAAANAAAGAGLEAPVPVTEVIDEAAETINAAIDAAIDKAASATTVADSPTPSPASVAEADAQPAVDLPKPDDSS